MKILVSLFLIACTTVPAAALAQVKSLVYKEEKRRYLVYTPPSYDQQPHKAYPVVFNFHGSGMTMAEQMLYTQMNRAADRHQFIVVYPSGIKQDWNVGFGMSYLEGTDDIGFTAALLARLQQDYRVPTVISVHNAFPPADVDRWHQPLLRQAFAGVRGVYAVSASALAHFLAVYQPYLPASARLAVIPNPVDVTRFRPDAEARRATRARWGIPQDALVIGSVARLSPQKQPATVLALFGMLKWV